MPWYAPPAAKEPPLHQFFMRLPRSRRLIEADSGATAVEYALIVFFIFLLIIAAVTLIGQEVFGMFAAVPAF